MAYARLSTRNTSGLHPNLRGMGAYAQLHTGNSAGLRPGFRGLGQAATVAPTESLTIGPAGQFSFGIASAPVPVTSSDVFQNFMTWMAQPSTYMPGVPNSVFLIAGGALAFAWILSGRKR
jgi:hypothetical protein